MRRNNNISAGIHQSQQSLPSIVKLNQYQQKLNLTRLIDSDINAPEYPMAGNQFEPNRQIPNQRQYLF